MERAEERADLLPDGECLPRRSPVERECGAEIGLHGAGEAGADSIVIARRADARLAGVRRRIEDADARIVGAEAGFVVRLVSPVDRRPSQPDDEPLTLRGADVVGLMPRARTESPEGPTVPQWRVAARGERGIDAFVDGSHGITNAAARRRRCGGTRATTPAR